MTPRTPLSLRRPAALVAASALFCLTLALTACGGGGSDMTSATPAAASDASSAASLAAQVQLQPTYHLSPVLPGDPTDVDRNGSSASAHMQPRSVDIPASRQGINTRALTFQELEDGNARARALGAGSTTTTPQAAAATSVTYTPAQIRAAYGLPPVPTSLTGLTALQAAQLGAGQTVYVVDAFHDTYAFNELAAFSSQFGLPACTKKTLATTAALPLAAPSTTQPGCEFYQVASTSSGTVAATFPRYDAQWATEIALDVQWVHAIAPLARIVLVEASDASMAAMNGAIQLANRMGPGVMSMSFGAPEGSYVSSLDALFKTPGMSYFAATGDNGTAVNWPAASPNVVAVGGTSLRYSGTGSRTETAWSLAGGGISAYVALPSYQNATLLRTTGITRRSVADVSMNADPTTGHYVAIIPNQSTCTFCQVSWVTTGGTSLSTPLWAGLTAVANALRAQAGKGPIGAAHATLYQAMANTTTYTSAFLDVVQGANGSCSTCAAKAGYDGPTGLGTPNGLAMLSLLTNSAGATSTPTAPVAPTVASATVNGAYGQAISFTPSVSSANAFTLSLTGAPAGMVLSGTLVNWPSPVTGTFKVNVVARDAKTGLTGTGVYTVVVTPPPPPIVGNGSLTATVGKALSFAVGAADRYPVKLSLVGAPAGMTLTTTTGSNVGTVNWPKPLAGTFRFGVRADSTRTGLWTQGTYTVVVNPVAAPQVATGQLSARTGSAWSASVHVVAANPYTLSLTGAPAGLTINSAGLLSWASPVAGTYAITVQARDTKTGVVGSGVINLVVGSGTGPAVFSTVMTGVVGKPLNGTILITDATASLVGVGFSANQAGIKFTTALGMGTTTVSWPAPVTGNYTILVSVTDSVGKSTVASIPVVINAK
jgi:hypothetical protein